MVRGEKSFTGSVIKRENGEYSVSWEDVEHIEKKLWIRAEIRELWGENRKQ